MYLQVARRSKTPNRKFKGHTNRVKGIIHLPGGQRVITSSDGILRVWDLQSGKQIENGRGDEASAVWSIALSPDGKKIASGHRDGAVELRNIDTGKAIDKWMGHTEYVNSVCWNRDGRRVVSGCSNGSVRVWNVESGKTVLAIETGLTGVTAVVFSPDSTMIATGGGRAFPEEEEFLKIWDAKTGKLVTNLKGHTDKLLKVYCLAWTADGTTLISGSYDCLIRMWNTTTWQQTAVLTGHAGVVHGIAISPNGRILASASWDYTVQLWNLENGQPIRSPLQHAHSLAVDSVSFSTDGKLLATGCWDHNAYSWDISGIVRKTDLDELPNPSGRRHLLLFTAHLHHVSGDISAHGRALLSRVSSLSRRTYDRLHDTLPQPRRPGRPRKPFYSMPRTQNEEHIELQEHRPVVVDIAYARRKRRNVSAAEVKFEKEKASAKKASAGSSRPHQSSVTQQAGGVIHVQQTSGLHATDVSAPSTTPAIVASSAATTLTTSTLM